MLPWQWLSPRCFAQAIIFFAGFQAITLYQLTFNTPLHPSKDYNRPRSSLWPHLIQRLENWMRGVFYWEVICIAASNVIAFNFNLPLGSEQPNIEFTPVIMSTMRNLSWSVGRFPSSFLFGLGWLWFNPNRVPITSKLTSRSCVYVRSFFLTLCFPVLFHYQKKKSAFPREWDDWAAA